MSHDRAVRWNIRFDTDADARRTPPIGSRCACSDRRNLKHCPGLEQDQETGYGTLRLFGSLPPTLDPALAQDSTSALYIVHIFSGLVTLNAEMEVSPDIAVEWDISPDGTVYTFRLNPDAVFQDGRPITAQDVIYSLERACSPELQSPTAVSYLGDIVGVEAYAAGKAEHISGLTR